MRQYLLAIIKRLQITRAVAAILAWKLWGMVAAPVTILVLMTFFTGAEQGYYYTFFSIHAMQNLLELGFSIAIVQITAHEWAHLKYSPEGEILGPERYKSRLISLGRIVLTWYGIISLLYVVGVGFIGYKFFALKSEDGISWKGPWILFVLSGGIQLLTVPFLSLIEGTNEVVSANLSRLAQAITFHVLMWCSLMMGGGLWSAGLGVLAGAIVVHIVVIKRYGRFFKAILSKKSLKVKVDWKKEVWPLQSRLAIAGVASYFGLSLFVPATFWFLGAVEAGRMGMTLQVLGAIQNLALAWLNAKVPQFGMLIARKEFEKLDEIFFRVAKITIMAIVFSVGLFAIFIGIGIRVWEPLSARFLSPPTILIFGMAYILSVVTQCVSAFVRAHKQEPFVLIGVTSNLMIGFLVFLLLPVGGTRAVAWGYLAVIFIVTLRMVQQAMEYRVTWREEGFS